MKSKSSTIIEMPTGGWKLNRLPTKPGEVLLKEFLEPLSITQVALARHIGCDQKVINRICNGRSAVTTAIAVKLANAFETTPQFWLNLQFAVDIWNEQQANEPIKSMLA